jgi:RHS repeat-associated protein
LLYEVDYKYDVFGNRVEADVDPEGDGDTDAITRYALDGWGSGRMPVSSADWNVWAELDGQNSNALLTRYLRGDVVDQIFAREDGSGNAYWTLTDRLGSVRDVTDNTGVVKDSLSYDAYGNIVSETASAYRGNYAWTGREFDGTTGLQYNRARYYDPATGRWQSQDLLGFGAGDCNLYRYAKNGPTTATDPSGLDATCVAAWTVGWAARQIVPGLTAEEVGPPVLGFGGAFVWPIRWKLTSPAPNDGYIIQHVYVTFKMDKGNHPGNDGKWDYFEVWPVKAGQIRTNVNRYFDAKFQQSIDALTGYKNALEVNKLPTQQVDGLIDRLNTMRRQLPDDVFSMSSGRASKGTIVFTGQAVYVDGMTERKLCDPMSKKGNNFKKFGESGHVQHAGVLISRYATRPFKDSFIQMYFWNINENKRVSNIVRHEITVKWDSLLPTGGLTEKNYLPWLDQSRTQLLSKVIKVLQ